MAASYKTPLQQARRPSLSEEGHTAAPTGDASATRPLSWALLGAAIASAGTGASSRTTRTGHSANDENTFSTAATIPSSMVTLPYQSQSGCLSCTTTSLTVIVNQAMLLETIEAVLDIVESDFDFDDEDDIEDSFGTD